MEIDWSVRSSSLPCALMITSPAELLDPHKLVVNEPEPKAEVPEPTLRESDLTEEEERELAELMED